MLPLASSNIGPVELVVFLAIVIAFGWGSGAVAKGKGYSFALFFVLGVIFGFIPLIIALVLPRRQQAAPAAADDRPSFMKG